MIFTLLALPLSFFTFFNIFFFNSHMWGLWSSFANAWFSCLLGCLLVFLLLLIFYYLLDGIRVLGILFGFTSLIFSFLQNKLDKDVCHVDAFSRLRDVQVTFGIPFQCFTHQPFYLFCSFSLYWSFNTNSLLSTWHSCKILGDSWAHALWTTHMFF